MGTCAQCGGQVPDEAGFCGNCGATQNRITSGSVRPKAHTHLGFTSPSDPPPPAIPAADPSQPVHATKAKTMLGGVMDPSMPLAPPPAPSSAPATVVDPGTRPNATMLGIAADDVIPPQSRAAMDATPAPPAAGQNRTMLGVAMPGIAPVSASAGVAPPPAGENRTMLGVAVPGIAPLHAGSPGAIPAPPASRPELNQSRRAKHAPQPAALPPIVPAPPPLRLDDEPLPRAPARSARRGLPIAIAAGAVALLVIAAGVIALFVVKSGPPLIVQPRLGPQGNELLHLVCDGCADGTIAEHAGAKATFKDKQADLELATPLVVGDNPVEIKLDRPGVGRDETVKAVVPIAYRVRADLADLGAPVPVITVRVEALAGSKAVVDGKPVDLDASGKGAHAIDLKAETEGPSDEGKVIEKTIGYEVTPPKATSPERGTVIVRFGVIPLHVDAPGSSLVTDKDKLFVAGRTAKGATVTINGKPVDAASGVFALQVDVKPGEQTFDVRSVAPQVAPRTAHVKVRRVTKVADEARAFEGTSHLGYDAVAGNIDANVGQPLVVDGNVLQSRVLNHQTVAIVDDHRGCAKKPCLVRVVYGAEIDLHGGEPVHAYGKIARAFKNEGANVPELEAEILLRGR